MLQKKRGKAGAPDGRHINLTQVISRWEDKALKKETKKDQLDTVEK